MHPGVRRRQNPLQRTLMEYEKKQEKITLGRSMSNKERSKADDDDDDDSSERPHNQPQD